MQTHMNKNTPETKSVKKPTPAQLQAMVVIVREEWHLGGTTNYASVYDRRDRWQNGIRKPTVKSLYQSPWFSDTTVEDEPNSNPRRRWEINAAGVALVMAKLNKSGRTETTPEEYRAAILAERDARRKIVQAEQDRKATSRKIIERSSPSYVSFSADRKNYTTFTLEMECLPKTTIYVTEYFNSDLDASDVKIEMSRCVFDVDDYQWFQVLMSRAAELAADRIAKLYADTQEPPVQGGGGGSVPETPAPQLLLPARAESLIPRYERCSNVGRDTPRSRWESHAVGASKPRQESKISVAGAVKLTKPQRKALELLAERAGHGVWSRIDISFVVLDRLSTMGFGKEITSEGHDRTDRNVDVLYCITPAGRAALGNTPPAPAVKDDPTVQAAHALLDEISEPLDFAPTVPNVYEYGLRNRPAWSAAPKGWIQVRTENLSEYDYGTVSYDHKLTPKELYDYEMYPVSPNAYEFAIGAAVWLNEVDPAEVVGYEDRGAYMVRLRIPNFEAPGLVVKAEQLIYRDIPTALDHHDAREVAAMEAVPTANPLRDTAEPERLLRASELRVGDVVEQDRKNYGSSHYTAKSGIALTVVAIAPDWEIANSTEIRLSAENNQRSTWNFTKRQNSDDPRWRLITRAEPPAPVTAPDALTAEERATVNVMQVRVAFEDNIESADVMDVLAIIRRLAPKGGVA